jgi:hypothetical protein
MSGEREKTVVVAVANTVLLAEAIAAALRDRGVNARVLDEGGAGTWGMPMSSGGGVKVEVLEHEKEAAALALSETRVESQSIDWDAVDLGSDEEARKLIQVSRTNRWIWTIAVLMVPIGLFVLAFGVDRGDPIIKVVGGTLLLTAIVMAVYQLFPERKDH